MGKNPLKNQTLLVIHWIVSHYISTFYTLFAFAIDIFWDNNFRSQARFHDNLTYLPDF